MSTSADVPVDTMPTEHHVEKSSTEIGKCFVRHVCEVEVSAEDYKPQLDERSKNAALVKNTADMSTDTSRLQFRDQIQTRNSDRKALARAARRSRREITNMDFVHSHRLPELFESLTIGLMVHQPDAPIQFLLECLMKVELSEEREYRRNMFAVGTQADGSELLEDGTRILTDGTRILADGTKVLVDGTKVLSDGTKVLADGTKVLTDGTRILANGTKVLADGTKILADGTHVLADGTKVLADGTKVLADGTKVLADGTKILADGTKILSNGTKVLADGTQLLADGTKILADGTKVLADGTQILADGTKVLQDGTKILADGTTIVADGTRVLVDGTKILADGTILDMEGNIIGKMDGDMGDLSPEEMVRQVKAQREAAEREELRQKMVERAKRRQRRTRALWLLAGKLARERQRLDSTANQLSGEITEAERRRREALEAKLLAEEQAREAEKRAQENEQAILRSTRGRLEALESLQKVQEKEAIAVEKIAKLKALRDAENSARPDSATSVSSVDSSRPPSGVPRDNSASVLEGSSLAWASSGPSDGGEELSQVHLERTNSPKVAGLPQIVAGIKTRVVTVSEKDTNNNASVTGSTPTLVAIKRTVNDVGGVPNTGVAAPSSTVVKLPKIAQNMAVASTARTVPVSMNNN